jgi:ABC-type branched-subunit amino acid transport system ATPase component
MIMSWKVIHCDDRPFRIKIADEKDNSILVLDMPAYSSTSNSVFDVMNGKGFKGEEKEKAKELNKKQIELACLLAAAPELLATLQEIADGVFCDLRSVEEYAARSLQKVTDSIAKAKGDC